MKTGRKNRLAVAVAAVMCGLAALAMPTRDELVQAQKLVQDLTADDVRALKAGTKKAGEVAAAQLALADEAETEAGKYLLLQGAFKLYARSADYDAAADALARMRKEIADLPPEVVVELVNGEMRRVAAEKAPKVLAIFRDAQRTIKCRKDLEAAETAAKARPGNAAAQRRLAECHAGLGDWTKALEVFAQIGDEAAKYELDPSSAKGYDALKAANYWWEYSAKDDEPFKVHAATLYKKGLDDGSISGLRKTLAEKRVKQMESVMPTEGDGSAANVSAAPRGGSQLYCVIDLSAGPNASKYPVSYLAAEPKGGWTDEHKTTKLVLRRIEPGKFMMGGQYEVTLTKPFYCGVFEVTQKQYELVTGSNPSYCRGDRRPVEKVSWNMIRGDSSTYNWPSSVNVDSSTFIGKIQARTGINFDLPTEAQWEYACRAGTTSEYNNGGATEDDLKRLGRYNGNQSDGKGGWSQHTTTVGSYQPNAWGLYDMHGNVHEWCLDWNGNRSDSGVTDPSSPSSGSDRVLRGGCWSFNANRCISSYRGYINPSRYNSQDGFRLCMNPEGPVGASARGSGAPAASDKAPDARATRPMTIKLSGGVEIEMLPCPAGTFTMGTIGSSSQQSAWRAHQVTISRSFWMSKYPLTYAQAKAITGKSCKEKNQWGVPPFPWDALGGDKTPAGMSPQQALELLETMNAKYASRLPKGYVFRFPTEAEWEYGFKGGKEKYWDGAACKRRIISVEERQKAMERKGLKVRDFEKFPWVLPYVSVGTKEPNEWGFYDLLGNGWTYLLDTVEGDHSARLLDIGADEILAGLYKDGDTDPVPYYEGKGKRIVMRGSGWGDAKFKGQRYKKVLFSSADVFHHDGHIRLVIGPDLLKERGIK